MSKKVINTLWAGLRIYRTWILA